MAPQLAARGLPLWLGTRPLPTRWPTAEHVETHPLPALSPHRGAKVVINSAAQFTVVTAAPGLLSALAGALGQVKDAFGFAPDPVPKSPACCPDQEQLQPAAPQKRKRDDDCEVASKETATATKQVGTWWAIIGTVGGGGMNSMPMSRLVLIADLPCPQYPGDSREEDEDAAWCIPEAEGHLLR